MSIELDWQVVDEDAPPPDQTSSPSIKPHRTRPRVIWIALAVVASAVVSVAVYSAWAYRAGLAQASDQVRLVARLEAQAVAQGDRESFMALQDPDDSAWRSVQSKRFGQLERAGLTEFGWKAAGTSPQFGSVSLEPDGARLDVTYRFSVTQPLPGGPVTVSVQVPQYYKRTPSGWVRAMPGPDFWGGWRKLNGKHIVVIYFQRDAALIEPFVPRLDEVMDRVCESLTCPVLLPITFDRFPETLLSLSDFSYGYDNNGLELPSPHWIGLPADSASREELYRAYGTRLAQALVYKASNSRLMMSYLTSKEFVRWELAQAGLSGPFISEAVSRTLMAAPAIARQPLSAISVHSRWLGLDASPGEVVVPLAFDFLERQFGAGTVPRLLPALATPRIGTLGEAISMTLRVSSATLEPAWQNYVRQLSEALSADSPPPGGELALWCARNTLRNSFSIWRIRADGTGLAQISSGEDPVWSPHWSPDGKQLAYAQGDAALARVWVRDADTFVSRTVAIERGAAPSISWLADNRLLATAQNRIRLMNIVTGEDLEISGPNYIWSPDGTRTVSMRMAQYPTMTLGLADANGRNEQPIAPGERPTWSPDSRRLAVWVSPDSMPQGEAGILDVQTGAHVELPGKAFGWSPDGKWLAVAQDPSGLLLLAPDQSSKCWLDTPDCFDVSWRPGGH